MSYREVLMKNISEFLDKKDILLTCFLRFLAISFLCLCFTFPASNSYSLNKKRPIADKLWHEVNKKDRKLLTKISILLESSQYDKALNLADKLHENNKEVANKNNPFFVKREGLQDALKNIILWQKYSDLTREKENLELSEISFNDISRFVDDNKFYPNSANLRRKVEEIASKNQIPYRLSEKYFLSNPALDLNSKLYLIEAKSEFLLRFNGSEEQKDEIAKQINQMIVDVWASESFSAEQEKEFLQKYGDNLVFENHKDRVNRLVWDRKFDEAKRIFRFLDKDHKKLFNAIIQIRKLPKYINRHIISVPRSLRSHNNLIYSRILWHKSRDEMDEVVDLLLDVKDVKYPQKWWSVRRLYARELLKTKDFKDSYRIISRHSIEPGRPNHWEGEWMSGWISLRFLDNPEIAYGHFLELYNNVRQPVSLARASYWLGMAALEVGDKKKALDWYKIASQYPLYFYGQLAIHKSRKLDPLNSTEDIILPKDPDITVGDARNIAKNMGAKVGYLLAIMGDRVNSTDVFSYEVGHSESEGEIAVLMRLVNEFEDGEMNSVIAREASKKNVFFIRDKFQIIEGVDDKEYAPLVHAIIKQESGFNVSAVSSVGAIGFMQIMPGTAQNVADDSGMSYSRWRLANDRDYNIKLGTYYIKQMVERFEGSEMLAIASYNAGPHNAERWIREFYDPRDEEDIDKVVDWIELITYSETRNYVQRIMENLIVYKYLMKENVNSE